MIRFTTPRWFRLVPMQVCEPRAPYGDWGDVDARLRPRLLRHAMRFLGNHEDAEDAVQDAFLRAWSDEGNVRDPGAFEGWVLGVLRYVSLSLVRRRAVRTTASCSSNPEPVDDQLADPCMALSLADAIECLPKQQRHVLMQAIQGVELAEIARFEGVSYSVITTRLSRARTALRQIIGA